MKLRLIIVAAALMLPLAGCKENRVPNGIVSEAVDEMKLAKLTSDPAVQHEHLVRAAADFARVMNEYPQSRAARFLREGGKFNGMTFAELSARAAEGTP